MAFNCNLLKRARHSRRQRALVFNFGKNTQQDSQVTLALNKTWYSGDAIQHSVNVKRNTPWTTLMRSCMNILFRKLETHVTSSDMICRWMGIFQLRVKNALVQHQAWNHNRQPDFYETLVHRFSLQSPCFVLHLYHK